MRILILGGTGEATALGRLLAGDARFHATISLAGRTQSPAPQPLPSRTGGFGGADGLARYLKDHAIAALVDATHPFAARISANAELAARATNTPLLVISRPPWTAEPDDRWHGVADMQAAADKLGPVPRRVLLTIGQKDLAPFVAASWHHYVLRSVDPPPPELRPLGAEIITARPPFTEDHERRLLLDRHIDVLVTKNSGGEATQAKLAAARALALPVVMVTRPAPPIAETVGTAAEALDWLGRRHAASRRGA